jgi:hypothetical protein
MASETLEAFVASIGSNRNHGRDDETGHVLALVGEWDGNTADGAFARLLTKHFYLARRAALPQWGDTAHELTVWKRKTGNRAVDVAIPLKSCAWCGGGGSKATPFRRRSRTTTETFCDGAFCVATTAGRFARLRARGSARRSTRRRTSFG